jgi:maleylpyruvate isomerase
MRLYSYYRSSSAWRVRLVLSWKKVEYEYAAVNLAPGTSAQHAAEFSVKNPLKQVPVLEWTRGEEVLRLTQSVAICEYLEELYPEPSLMPREPLARARVRQLVETVTSGIQPLQNTGTLAEVARLTSADAARVWAQNAVRQGLPALEAFARAHGGAFAVGDAVTLADVYIVPQLYNARRFELDLSPYPKLVEIDARASALDAFVRAHPDNQIDSPARTAAG